MKHDPRNAMLYDFQREDVEYLVRHGGGCLWNDPGLGKTRTSIVAAKKLGGPVLIICPNILKRWWAKEIRQMYPKSSIAVAGQGGRFGSHNLLPLPNNGRPIPYWTIVHYTGARINCRQLSRVPWNVVILDEAHYIKNRKAERSKSVMELTPARAYRIALTATPFGNNPADLWHQLRWIAPYVKGLRSYWRFFNTFVDYDWEERGQQKYRKIKGGKNLELLAKVMAGYGVRHSKKEVAPQLPPVTTTHIPLELEGRQAEVYHMLRKKSNVEINIPADRDGPEYRMIIPNALARLIRLEQWLSHPWKYKHGVNGAKLEWLLEWMEGYNEQAVIAVRFKETAYHIADILKDKEWIDVDVRGLLSTPQAREHSKRRDALGRVATPILERERHTLCRHPITGDISTGARDSIIKDWKSGKHQYLIGTIDTIGVGLSFEQAHAMVCFDQMYSAIKMDQLWQRVHRITTDHPVEILYPYIQGTTNELVLESFTHSWKQMQLVNKFIEHIQEDEDDDDKV